MSSAEVLDWIITEMGLLLCEVTLCCGDVQMEVIQAAGPSATPWGAPRGRSWQQLTPAGHIPSSPAVAGSASASFPVPYWNPFKAKPN